MNNSVICDGACNEDICELCQHGHAHDINYDCEEVDCDELSIKVTCIDIDEFYETHTIPEYLKENV